MRGQRVGRLFAAGVLAVILPLTLAAGCPSQSPADDAVEVEVEDCDAEDQRNREAECGFLPAPPGSRAVTTTKPAPARTTAPAKKPPMQRTTKARR